MSKSTERMTKEQRAEATRRVLAGEKASALAAEYGVTRAYISLLKMQALEPERFQKKHEQKLTRKLTTEQLTALREKMLEANPFEQGLEPPSVRWRPEHVTQLAQRLFGKRPSKRVVDECLEAVTPPREPNYILRKPQPPPKHHISQIDPELAKDPDFVEYYLSPAAERLAYREYELALADWQARYGDAEVVDLRKGMQEEEEKFEWEYPAHDLRRPGVPAAPGQRVGKHAGSKGSPFTPSKKKRRKKRR